MKAFFLLTTILFIIFGLSNTKACTSACLVANGQVVFGNNLDWYVDDGYIFINKRNVEKKGLWFDNPPVWVSKYASITVNQDGREFPSRGMNEAGLVIGEMTLRETEYPDPDSRFVVNTLQWMQYQLDNSATIADVLATDKIIRIDKNEYHSHFFICDSTGNCVTMEWLNGKLVAHAYNDVPIKVLANTRYDYCIEHGNDLSGRFGRAAEMLKKHTTENPVDYMFSILQNVSQATTKWSLVFDSKNRKLFYKTAKNHEIRYISLTDFNFSCNSDVYMIDVNGEGIGDMTQKCIPYVQQLNEKLTRSVYHQLEHQFGPFTEETMSKIFRYPASTSCKK
jgi:choloylglycine hydrolase